MTSRQIYVDVDLDDFDAEELIDELESRGYSVTKDAISIDTLGSFSHVQHLADCGLIQDARTEAIGLIESAIGRRLQ